MFRAGERRRRSSGVSDASLTRGSGKCVEVLALAIVSLAPPIGAEERLPRAGARTEIAAEATRAFDVVLASDELLHVAVDPAGADVALRIVGPEGVILWSTDAHDVARREEAWLVAEAGGRHRVEVVNRSPRAGVVAFGVVERRPASTSDRERVAAERELEGARVALKAGGVDGRAEGARLGRSARERFAALGLPGREAAALRYVARASPDLDAGDALLREALDLVPGDDGTIRGPVINSRAVLAWRQGRQQDALELADRAVALARSRGDPFREAEASNTRGLALGALGRHAEAADAYAIAADRFGEVAGDTGQVLARHNYGAAQLARGDFDTALDAFAAAAREFGRLGNRGFEAVVLSNLGALYLELGDPERAIPYAERAARVHADLEQPVQRGDALLNHGGALAELDREAEAAELYREARSLYAAAGSKEREARAVYALAELDRDAGRYEAAGSRLERALPLQREAGAGEALVATLSALGDVDRELGRLDAAGRHLDEALERARDADQALDEALALYRLARLSLVRGEVARARDRVAEAIAAVEAVRARLGSRELRAGLMSRVRGYYELAIELELRPGADAGSLERAFHWSERAHARALFDLLARSRVRVERRLDPALRERRERLSASITDELRRLREAGERGNAAGLATRRVRLDALYDEWALLEDQARARDASYAAFASPEPLGLEEARAALRPGEALLAYFLGDRASYLLAIVAGRPSAHRLPARHEIEERVADLRQALARPSRRGLPALAATASALFETLVGPVADRLDGVERLIVVPDGALHALPFEALLTAPVRRPRSAGGLPWLVRRFEVRMVPSASLFARWPLTGREPALELVAFADPQGGAAYARVPEAYRGAQGIELALTPLPHARREVEAAAAAFPEDAVALFLGDEATESRARGPLAAGARQLHFATHGVVSARRPAESALLLAPPRGEEEDGLLEVREILGLNLAAETVVLSACSSGLGRHVQGEGFLGLAQAFFLAGARQLVVSLWPVADRASADLMARFYGERARGATTPAALRAAKLALLQGRALAHPFYWAPFVVVGGAAPTGGAG